MVTDQIVSYDGVELAKFKFILNSKKAFIDYIMCAFLFEKFTEISLSMSSCLTEEDLEEFFINGDRLSRLHDYLWDFSECTNYLDSEISKIFYKFVPIINKTTKKFYKIICKTIKLQKKKKYRLRKKKIKEESGFNSEFDNKYFKALSKTRYTQDDFRMPINIVILRNLNKIKVCYVNFSRTYLY
jgi:hypothetical protein